MVTHLAGCRDLLWCFVAEECIEDILFLDSILLAKHTPKDERDADIRKNYYEQGKKRAFERFVDGLVVQHKVTKNEAALDAVQVDALVGLP